MADAGQYQAAVTDYAAELRNLFVVPKEAPRTEVTMRGSGGVPPEVMATRAKQFVASSQRMGAQSVSMLDSFDPSPREKAEINLLVQATAQIQIAQSFLETASEQQQAVPGVTMRGGNTIMLQQSLGDLAKVLEVPADQGIRGLTRSTRDVILPPKDLQSARAALQDQVNTSVDYISRRTAQTGGQVLRDLLLMDAATVLDGVSLVSKDFSQAIDKVLSGVGKVALDLATAALQLLLQAYDWVVTLIGKDGESAARKQVGQWVDQLRNESQNGDSSGPFEMLVERIYVPQTIKADVARWVPLSTAELDKVIKTTQAVHDLADKYRAKTEQVDKLSKAIAFVRKMPLLAAPQAQALVAAVDVALLGYVVYSGYDHVDSGRVVFFQRYNINIPSRVNGVRKTVAQMLGVADQPATDGGTPAAPSPAPA